MADTLADKLNRTDSGIGEDWSTPAEREAAQYAVSPRGSKWLSPEQRDQLADWLEKNRDMDDSALREELGRRISTFYQESLRNKQEPTAEQEAPEVAYPGGISEEQASALREKEAEEAAYKKQVPASTGRDTSEREATTPAPATRTEEVPATAEEVGTPPEEVGPPTSAALSQDEQLAYRDLMEELTPKQALARLAEAYRAKREGKASAGRAQVLFTLADALVKLGAATRGVDLTGKKGPEILRNLEAGIEQTFDEESGRIRTGLARGQAAERAREAAEKQMQAAQEKWERDMRKAEMSTLKTMEQVRLKQLAIENANAALVEDYGTIRRIFDAMPAEEAIKRMDKLLFEGKNDPIPKEVWTAAKRELAQTDDKMGYIQNLFQYYMKKAEADLAAVELRRREIQARRGGEPETTE